MCILPRVGLIVNCRRGRKRVECVGAVILRVFAVLVLPAWLDVARNILS